MNIATLNTPFVGTPNKRKTKGTFHDQQKLKPIMKCTFTNCTENAIIRKSSSLFLCEAHRKERIKSQGVVRQQSFFKGLIESSNLVNEG